MSSNLEHEFPGGRRARVEPPSHVSVELDLPGLGTQVFSGTPDRVSAIIGNLLPPKDPSILSSQTTGLGGPKSRRALP